LLHVVDASHPRWEEQVEVVMEVLSGLPLNDCRLVHVFNKLDRVREPEGLLAYARGRWGEVIGTSLVPPVRGVEQVRECLARFQRRVGLVGQASA
jgi:GTP-binding protein HflX